MKKLLVISSLVIASQAAAMESDNLLEIEKQKLELARAQLCVEILKNRNDTSFDTSNNSKARDYLTLYLEKNVQKITKSMPEKKSEKRRRINGAKPGATW
jgi:hypothetical protein